MIKEEIKQKVIELRKEGKTYNQIHDLTGVAKSSISDICRPLKLGGQQVIEITDDVINKAQKLYDEIGNIKKVAKQLHISYYRLSKIIIFKKSIPKPKKKVLQDWRKRTKIKLVNYKGGKCQCCGYDKCIEALEFHHVDPSKKDFQISGCHKSFENLKQEVDKCILVCANCHREIHAGLLKIN